MSKDFLKNFQKSRGTLSCPPSNMYRIQETIDFIQCLLYYSDGTFIFYNFYYEY